MKLQYEVEKMKFANIKDRVEIPRFQRGLVWKDERKKEFIRALKAGFPIGALLFSKKADGKYLVIDGLQRFTTMLDYSKDYFHYVDENEITDANIMSILYTSKQSQVAYDGSTQTVQEAYRRNIKQILVKSISNGDGKNTLAIAKDASVQICKEIPIIDSSDMEDVLFKVYEIVDNFEKKANIDDVEIPVIVFTGNSEDLATIYQNLNQKGVKLSKYDVFAATWINQTVVVKDNDFISHVIDKYKNASEDAELPISSFDPSELYRTGVLTVFEYAFGLGKEMAKKCPDLFGTQKKDDSKIDGVSFLLLSEIFGVPFLEMSRLAEEMVKYKSVLDFKELKDTLIEISSNIQSILSCYIKAPSGQKGTYSCHADFQIVSYIAVLFKLQYELSTTEGLKKTSGNAKTVKAVKQNIPKHYLFDILRDHWSGAGNIKLEDLLVDPKTCRYTLDVSRPSFEQTISDWLQRGNDKYSETITTETRLFWNYYLHHCFSSAELSSGKYDMEHCVPKNVLKNYFSKKGTAAAISSPCNLVFIPRGDNRSKEDLTYYQKKAKNPTAFTLDESQLDKYLYPTHGELSFVEATDTITIDNYRRFLRDRKTTITKRFSDALYK